jgi:hypothetical protein
MRLDVILILTIAPQRNYTNGNYNHFSLGLDYGVDMPRLITMVHYYLMVVFINFKVQPIPNGE